ncbi:GspE/PulE family protein [Puniceicoccaceae bacterium K14]|nr:GspE/PulE family protein [Puniceicoccaceae bacterium K14]
MFEARNESIFEIALKQLGIEEAMLEELRPSWAGAGKSMASLLVERGFVEKDELLDSVAVFLGLRRCLNIPPEIPRGIIDLIDTSTARMYGVIPVGESGPFIEVIAIDPFNPQLVDDLDFIVGRSTRILVADPKDVEDLLDVYYRTSDRDYVGILEEVDYRNVDLDTNLSVDDLLSMAGETPIIRFVNLVLAQAINDKASDIHFEPFEKDFKIRYRIDGALYEMSPPPKELTIPITSRIKVIGNLNISERRIPQDGKVRLTVSGRPVDLRISTLPTQFGESVVLRVLDQSATSLDLNNVGMPEDVLETVREAITKPNGIFIVTGPTGSGKTTTLYSCLKELNVVGSKLMTVEDPIEYEIDGIMQVAVNHAVGLGFANALKAFLRQDPDIIMVGEIRDIETAQIAIQSSLTGHLVLSTLHTNDAPGAITRLRDMGVEPFLIASSLEAVLAQRLLRRVCNDCRRSYMPSLGMLTQLDLDPGTLAENEFYNGKGCASCANTGYRGRLGIFEMLEISESLREKINEGVPTITIRDMALQQGMRMLREDGIRNIFTGTTTIEEVLRYT